MGRLPRAEIVEPFQTRASLKLSQQKEEEAEALLLQALEIVRRAEGEEEEEGGQGEGGSGTGGTGAVASAAAEELPEMPSLELRLALSKMLMEVGRAVDALEVLQGTLAEDDDSCEIRYLLCTAALLAGEAELARDVAAEVRAHCPPPAPAPHSN